MATKTELKNKIAEIRKKMQADVAPFDDNTPEAKAERIRRSKEEDFFFERTYLPHYFNREPAEFHEELHELAKIEDEPVFVAAPREHAKSTICTLGVPVGDICLERKHFIIIISDTEDLAADFNLFIQLELEENERIKADFGNLKGRSWSAADFTTKNGIRVKARGRGQRIRGIRNRQYRPDRVLIDDFENDKNVKNPRLIKEAVDWILTAVLGSLAHNFSMMMIGTLLDKKSVLAWFLDAKDEHEQPLYITRRYQAILDEGTSNERPLWPENWPMERLQKKKRQIGTVRFNKEFQNSPKDEDGIFQEGWIKYYFAEELLGKSLAVYDYIDPSVGKNESSDYRALVKVGKDLATGILYVLNADIKKRSIDSLVGTVYVRQADEPALAIGLEDVAFQSVLMIPFNMEAEKRKRHLPLRLMPATIAKEVRITRLSPLVERGIIRFRKGHSDQDLLVEQMIYFPSSTVNDDGPDALEGAVGLAEGAGGGPIEYQTVASRSSKMGAQKGAW